MTYVLFMLALALAPLTGAAAPSISKWKPAKDCRANIRAVTCRVMALTPAQESDPRHTRTCLGGENIYVQELLKIHDELPPKMQKMFCHLRKIYIEEEFYATAYASRFMEVLKDQSGQEQVVINGNVLGLNRKKIFASKYSLSEWLNRKNQTLFGRQMEDPLLPNMPKLEVSFMGYKSNPLLLDIVLHEFGHLFDFAHRFVDYQAPEDPKCSEPKARELDECQPTYSGLWSSISWLPDGTIRPEDRYFGDHLPCYYNCPPERQLNTGQAVDFYRGLLNTNSFVSAYASVNPSEDFAESFATYIADNYLFLLDGAGKFYFSTITLPGEETTRIDLAKGRVKAKMNFMAMFDGMGWKYQAAPVNIPMEFWSSMPKQACY